LSLKPGVASSRGRVRSLEEEDDDVGLVPDREVLSVLCPVSSVPGAFVRSAEPAGPSIAGSDGFVRTPYFTVT